MKFAAFLFLAATVLSGTIYASEVVFPHVASGPNYWTEVRITNQEAVTATVSLSFFLPQGQPTDIFHDASQGSLTLVAHGTVSVRLKQPLQNTTGWGRARSSAAIIGLLEISYRPAPVTTSSASFDNLRLQSIARVSGSINDSSRKTAIAVCNPSAIPLNLDLDVFGEGEAFLARIQWTVPPLNQRALFVDELKVPGAHSVEMLSRTGLFSAISVSQSTTEMSANQVGEVIQKRFAIQEQKLDLGFVAYQVKGRGNIAVVTGNNGVNLFDLSTATLLKTIPLALEDRVTESIAAHPVKSLVAVAGFVETIVINLDTLSVVKRFSARRATVAFDNLTDTLVIGEPQDFGLGSGAQFTVYNQNFDVLATKLISFGPGRPQARNGLLVVDTGSAFFHVLILPSLQSLVFKGLPGGGTSYYPRISGDNIVALGPDVPGVSPAENFLTLYYLDSGRTETIALGEPVDTKVVQKERIYLTRGNKLRVVDLLQRRIIYSSLLSFVPKDMDFYSEGNALLGLEAGALRILKISAQ
ncbi:MAG: hypothetical protein ACR2L2_07180 [Acidobacteriota bacterium]